MQYKYIGSYSVFLAKMTLLLQLKYAWHDFMAFLYHTLILNKNDALFFPK